MAETPETTLKSGTILAVEDSPTQLEALRYLLEEAGFSVVTAANGREGLAAVRANAIDLVISDVVMPHLDGYALCKALRADETLRDLPVILLTALSDPTDVIRGLESGANHFICKPYDDRTLLARVRNVLANQEIRRAAPHAPGLGILFAGQRFFITAERPQILDMLLSTYENAVEQNAEVTRARDTLRTFNQQLEARVAERTAELAAEVAEHRRALEALRKSEARYRTLVENIPQKIFMKDRDFRWVSINERLAHDLGIRPEEVVGKVDADLFPPELAAKYHADDISVMDTGKTEEFVERYSQEGVGTWISTIKAPVRNTDGEIVGLLGVSWDITDRKRAEEALLESEARSRSLFECAPDALIVVGTDGRIEAVNEAAVTRYGYSREEFLAMGVNQLAAPDLESLAAVRVKEALEGGTSFEWRHRRKDGSEIHVEIRANRFDFAGQPSLLASVRDITERRQSEKERAKLEEQLRASQRMEAIGSLAGGVAHDFNNLLSVILGYTSFAIEGMPEGDPVRNDLLEVKKAGERASAVTRQLLAFGRRQVLQPVPLDLNQVSEGVEKMLRRILGEDITLVQTLAPDLWRTLADPGQIEQVLVNLVVNARDAMREGGRLTIETSNVEIGEEDAARQVGVKPGSYVRLAVTDTGCGMDQQTRERIFEPFFTTKEVGKGTGLGLSTAYGIIKQSHGNIWVYSEPGHGTTFKIYLPREFPAPAAPATVLATVPTQATGTETILVTEDEEALQNVARRTLEAAGYTVLVARDGDDALRISSLHAGDIHLLLTDMVMPGMGGRMLARILSGRRPSTRVLYMSGYADDAIVHHGALEAGTHFLAKPFTSADLRCKVREVLDAGVPDVRDRYAPATGTGAEPTESTLDREALRALPGDLLDRLLKAVTAARYDELVELVETVRRTDPDLATSLRRMADGFDYDGMRNLLRE
ncbi:MAG: response regulator [Holophagales bacterium]|nr:response regulator [Holophagales bacterium]